MGVMIMSDLTIAIVSCALLVVGGCISTTPEHLVPLQQTPTSFSRDGKPLIEARLGDIRIIPCEKIQHNVTMSYQYPGNREQVEALLARYKEHFERQLAQAIKDLLNTSGLFSNSGQDVVNFKAEVVSVVESDPSPFTEMFEATIRCEFRSSDGTVLLTIPSGATFVARGDCRSWLATAPLSWLK